PPPGTGEPRSATGLTVEPAAEYTPYPNVVAEESPTNAARPAPADRLEKSRKFPVPPGIGVVVSATRVTGPPDQVYTPNALKLLLTPRNVTAPPPSTGGSNPLYGVVPPGATAALSVTRVKLTW